MPKTDSSTGEMIISETGNWNVASDFARIKIMTPMAKCEYYKDIALFGYESVIDELMGYQIQNDLVRFTGFKRLVNELLKVCKNSEFAMKKPKTKETLKGFEEQLKKIKKVFHLLVKIKKNDINKTKELEIIPEKFDKVLDIVIEIESAINVPLNQNHLIFTDKEEFNIRAFKEMQKTKMTERG